MVYTRKGVAVSLVSIIPSTIPGIPTTNLYTWAIVYNGMHIVEAHNDILVVSFK